MNDRGTRTTTRIPHLPVDLESGLGDRPNRWAIENNSIILSNARPNVRLNHVKSQTGLWKTDTEYLNWEFDSFQPRCSIQFLSPSPNR